MSSEHVHPAPAEAISRRSVLTGMAAAGLAPLLPGYASAATDDVRKAVGEMLLLGFKGAKAEGASARTLASWIRTGRASGAFFVKDNIGSRSDVAKLVKQFTAGSALPPLIAIDHEGGWVQRLKEKQGFKKLAKAEVISATLTPEQAKVVYAEAASGLAALGFTVNFAPVVDFYDQNNPPIGQQGRAYSSDPAVITAYAGAFIDAFAAAGIVCTVKHFPGHGRSRDDSHKSLPDITKTWSEAELQPFTTLIASGQARIIMGGHLQLGDGPTTLSFKTTTELLRQKLGFTGIIMTDDIDMAAIRSVASRRQAVIRAIAAGNDLIMIQNVVAADSNLADTIADWVTEAVAKSELDANAIMASAARIRSLRAELQQQLASRAAP
jgi:beta-N-acetylhexosaminidase